MEREEVERIVLANVTDCFGLEPGEAKSPSRLVSDLGCESIDLIDLAFRLERAFKIEAPRSEFFPIEVLSEDRYVLDGCATPDGVGVLKTKLAYVDWSEPRYAAWTADPVLAKFPALLSVSDLVRYIESKVP